MAKKDTPTTAPVEPLTFDFAAVADLPRFRRRPTYLERIGWLLDEWLRDGRLSPNEMATLLAIAYIESGYDLDALSGPDAPDAAVGDAHSMFQFTLRTLEGLGVDVRQLLPWRDTSGRILPGEFQRATRANARAVIVALFAHFGPAGGPWLPWIRDRYGNDPAAVARAMILRWSLGPARGWDYCYARNAQNVLYKPVGEIPPNREVGSGGYAHYQLATKLKHRAYFAQGMGLPHVLPSGLKVHPDEMPVV